MITLAKSLEPLISRVRTDVTAKFSNGRMMWTGEELSPSRLNEHIFTNIVRGVCPIKAGESTARCALLDLDSHKGETAWPEMLNVAETVMNALKEHDLFPCPWRSRGGKGIHLIMLWDEPQDACSVRGYLSKILNKISYKNGTKGVASGEIEIFPKQSFVPSGGFGNQFILPLAGQSVPLIYRDFIGLELGTREDALNVKWQMSEAVPIADHNPYSAEAAFDIFGQDDLPKFRDMLSYIDPFTIPYDEWTKIGMALCNETGGSVEGLNLWDDWSAGNVRISG